MKNQNLKFKFIDRITKSKDKLLIYSLLLNSLLLVLSFFIGKEDIQVVSIFSIWLTGIIYCLFNIYERILGLVFLSAFYNFLIGRGLLILLGIYNEPYSFTNEESIKGQRLILFSIYIFVYSYIIINKYFEKRKNNRDTVPKKELELEQKEKQRIKIQKLSRTIFYITYVFLILNVLLTIRYVLKEGYTSLYVGSYRKTNFILSKIGDFAPIMFLAFLSTMPSKKQIAFPLFLYMIYLVLTIGVGARFDFVIGVLIVFVYIVLRNVIGKKEENKWFKLKYLKYLLILGIIAVILLSAFNTIRFGEELKDSNKTPVKLFTKFSYDQGISANMSKRIFKYEKLIPKDRYYSLCSLQTYGELVTSRLKRQKPIPSSSEEKAIKTATLSDRISYIMFTDDYLLGNGTGTSYIAEVFFDFGYIGLMIINMLYALLLVLSRKMLEKGVVPFIVGIAIFSTLLKVPRSSTDEFVIKVINPMIWLSVFILLVITKTKLYNLYAKIMEILLKPFKKIYGKYIKK